MFLLMLLFARQRLNLILICVENILFATTKIRMDLARQERVFGDISVPGVVIEW